ncbi:hypothetical protein HK105_201697 [Polyrhizophydium stewartii]|uniref:Mitochondrial glycine transporter n=1 Tax=Polyrhizophydium stewartii TaxID=2732419 RepID=A0ABR4NH62_9FUNG
MSGDQTLHLAAGGLSGLATCTLLQPFDLVKTRLQQSMQARQSLLRTLTAAQASALRELSVWTTVRDVVRSDGVRGLWRGTLPTILRNVPGSAMYFMVLNELRAHLRRVDAPAHIVHLASGAIARVVVGFAAMPITVVKIRYESNLYNYTSLWGAMSSIARHEGLPGFFRGFGATALRDAPYAGVYVLFYESLKTAVAGAELPPAAVSMAAGFMGGLSATLATQPFDMVKTRMQLKPAEYRGLVRSFAKIAASEGMRGFFAGMLPRLVRKPLSSAISWTVYEEVMRWFGARDGGGARARARGATTA